MAPRAPTTRPRRISDDVETFADEVAHDTVAAARVGWRIMSRVGRQGLEWLERTTDRVLKELR